MWLVHGPRESILCERAFSSQEAESGIAVTILISNAQPVLYCAVEAEPRTLVWRKAKLRNVSWPCRCPEDATKRDIQEGHPLAGSTACSTPGSSLRAACSTPGRTAQRGAIPAASQETTGREQTHGVASEVLRLTSTHVPRSASDASVDSGTALSALSFSTAS